MTRTLTVSHLPIAYALTSFANVEALFARRTPRVKLSFRQFMFTSTIPHLLGPQARTWTNVAASRGPIHLPRIQVRLLTVMHLLKNLSLSQLFLKPYTVGFPGSISLSTRVFWLIRELFMPRVCSSLARIITLHSEWRRVPLEPSWTEWRRLSNARRRRRNWRSKGPDRLFTQGRVLSKSEDVFVKLKFDVYYSTTTYPQSLYQPAIFSGIIVSCTASQSIAYGSQVLSPVSSPST